MDIIVRDMTDNMIKPLYINNLQFNKKQKRQRNKGQDLQRKVLMINGYR